MKIMSQIVNDVGKLFLDQNQFGNHHGFDKLGGSSKSYAKLVVATNPVLLRSVPITAL